MWIKENDMANVKRLPILAPTIVARTSAPYSVKAACSSTVQEAGSTVRYRSSEVCIFPPGEIAYADRFKLLVDVVVFCDGYCQMGRIVGNSIKMGVYRVKNH